MVLTWTLRNLILPAADFAQGQSSMDRLRFLESAQWWPKERLHQARDQQLQALIQVANYEIPLYREMWSAAGIAPGDIRTAADLVRLPIMTKAIFRAGHPAKTTRDTGQRTYEAHTSGSTGENFAVTEDARTRGWYQASFLLALEWAGWQLGEAHLQTGMTLNRKSWRRWKDSLLRCHYFSAFDLDDAHIDQALNVMDSQRIDHLWGYAASLYYFARRARQRGWNRPLKSVVTWGDNLYPHYRKEMELAFSSKVFDTYGVGEGMQVSAQCAEGNYHVHALDTIVEYADDHGNPVPADSPGQILLTRLHAGPMPLIRYRVGDLGIAGNQSLCPCGRPLDRMQGISGRDTDIVLTPSGNRLIVEFFNGIVDDIPAIDSFQVIQESLDSIQMTIVPRPGYSEETKRELIETMLRNGAGGLRIDVEVADSIPLTPGGKRRYVMNRIPRPSAGTPIA